MASISGCMERLLSLGLAVFLIFPISCGGNGHSFNDRSMLGAQPPFHGVAQPTTRHLVLVILAPQPPQELIDSAVMPIWNQLATAFTWTQAGIAIELERFSASTHREQLLQTNWSSSIASAEVRPISQFAVDVNNHSMADVSVLIPSAPDNGQACADDTIET